MFISEFNADVNRKLVAQSLTAPLNNPLPILFREQKDSDAVLACRFAAKLVAIYFPARQAGRIGMRGP